MKHYLSIVSIFKNESDILQEWLEHYLLEGVDHFYLIDNGSTDQYQSILAPYQKDKLVDLTIDTRPHMQEAHYNGYYLDTIKQDSEWVMIVDLDEFIYSRHQYKTITSYLKSLSPDIAQIYVPWKLYGSSGYIEPPPGCIDHFLLRTQYNHVKTNGMCDTEKILVKTISRGHYLTKMCIHCSIVTGKEITSDGQPIAGGNGPKFFQVINEQVLRDSHLHCNHYPIQSFEWFRKIKMTRGSANTAVNDKVRTFTYYNSFDNHSAHWPDDELSIKRHQLKVYYGVGRYTDVTRVVYQHFMDKSGGKIVIQPSVGFNHHFGDPAPGSEKYLIVSQQKQLTIYPENNHGTITILLPPPARI